jgi:protein-S-isoprenylcysteine O-methyltransferase Ste14
VAVPALLLASELNTAGMRFEAGVSRWFAVPLTGAGIFIFVWTVVDFVVRGRGTPNPADPPTRLVTSGPYRLSRNPMYVALVSVVIGEALWSGSRLLLIYAGLFIMAAHLRVIAYEEPTLRRTFGADYEAYSRNVPRWFFKL